MTGCSIPSSSVILVRMKASLSVVSEPAKHIRPGSRPPIEPRFPLQFPAEVAADVNAFL